MEIKFENDKSYSLTNHPAQDTLEVIAITQVFREKDKYTKLNDSEKKDYVQALNHTRTCEGCKERYSEMRDFYKAFVEELNAQNYQGTEEKLRLEGFLKKINYHNENNKQE